MPVYEAASKLPQRPPIILLYGEQGTSKTSIFHTCETPIHIDFDKGVSRSIGRKTTFIPDNWAEVISEGNRGLFKQYKTIGIDTIKAALDDYIAPHVVEVDYRLVKNKLQKFGEVGDQFKQFLLNRQSENNAIFIIAHNRRDEDTKRVQPDITGGSYQLVMRKADQVGYVFYKNNERWITFTPTEQVVAKNIAGIADMPIPPLDSIDFRTFGKKIVDMVTMALESMSEEQREAMMKSEQYQEQISTAETLADLSGLAHIICELPAYLNVPLIQVLTDRYKKDIKETDTAAKLNAALAEVNELPDFMRAGLRGIISLHAKEKGYPANLTTKAFDEPTATKTEVPSATPEAEPTLFTDKKTE